MKNTGTILLKNNFNSQLTKNVFGVFVSGENPCVVVEIILLEIEVQSALDFVNF